METLVNDGWVKKIIIRLHTQGFSVLHINKVIQGSGGKFGIFFFKMGPPNVHVTDTFPRKNYGSPVAPPAVSAPFLPGSTPEAQRPASNNVHLPLSRAQVKIR